MGNYGPKIYNKKKYTIYKSDDDIILNNKLNRLSSYFIFFLGIILLINEMLPYQSFIRLVMFGSSFNLAVIFIIYFYYVFKFKYFKEKYNDKSVKQKEYGLFKTKGISIFVLNILLIASIIILIINLTIKCFENRSFLDYIKGLGINYMSVGKVKSDIINIIYCYSFAILLYFGFVIRKLHFIEIKDHNLKKEVLKVITLLISLVIAAVCAILLMMNILKLHLNSIFIYTVFSIGYFLITSFVNDSLEDGIVKYVKKYVLILFSIILFVIGFLNISSENQVDVYIAIIIIIVTIFLLTYEEIKNALFNKRYLQ